MTACADVALERRLLAQVLRAPRSAQRLGQLSAADMTEAEHRAVLETVSALRVDGKLPWPETLKPALRKAHGWDELHVERVVKFISGEEPVTSVAAAVDRLVELGHLRRIRTAAMEVAAKAEAADLDGARSASTSLLQVSAAASDAPVRIQTAAEAVTAGWESIARLVDGSGERARQTTGDPELDRAVGPVSGGFQFVIGGYTGTGKSSVALRLCLGAAERKPGIISIEDSPTTWGKRLMAAHTTPPTNPADIVREAKMTRDQGAALMRAAERVQDCPIRIAYAVKRPVPDVLDAMRRLVTDEGCGYLVVDYIQAIRYDLGRSQRYDKLVAEGAARIKGLAADLDVPLVLLSQLRRPDRKGRGGGDPEPRVGDLKESGDLENESEIICLLWRPDRGKDQWGRAHPTKCRVAKSKDTEGGELFDVIRGDAGVVTHLKPLDDGGEPDADQYSDKRYG